MATIAYDQPVKDLIAALNATGHVTHTQHKKTKVTLHHNGAILSHEGVLEVWKTRPASAQFDVDAAGAVAQYVIANEYAWATGTTPGNQESVSIEMCNSSLAPSWGVSETTWRSAGRLAGWVFARIIGARPNSSNLVRHKYWKATECAGPHIDSVYSQVLTVADQSYDYFAHGIPMEDETMQYEEFASHMGRWWKYESRLEPMPSWEGGPTAPESLRDIRTAVDTLQATLGDDEANILAAIQQATSGGLSAEEQAALLRDRLDESVWLAVARLARGEGTQPTS